ncbi:hypothetical protein BH09MYX1_BH09MYX1_43370 [soil metagenome]
MRWIVLPALALIACAPAAEAPVAPVASSAPLPQNSATCDDGYTPATAWSGKKPVLPAPLPASATPDKIGDAFTVSGALHALKERFPPPEIQGDVAIIGVIVDSNLPRADKCALHRVGQRDPTGCTTPVPTFWIADRNDPAAPKIPVMGWASNFAHVYEAFLSAKKPGAKPIIDDVWATTVPMPLPAVGARIKLHGRYALSFTKSSNGVSTEPDTGIVTYASIDVIDVAPHAATFPQLGQAGR